MQTVTKKKRLSKAESDLFKLAESMVGGFSKPSKMPGLSWSIPATKCITGSRLRNIPGSTCAGCYALKGRYVFANVQNALSRRLESFNAFLANGKLKAFAGFLAIGAKHPSSNGNFRFFDSGDLQSVEMLECFAIAATLAPSVKFWLPTRERGIVKAFLMRGNVVPDNLNIRISFPMVGDTLETRESIERQFRDFPNISFSGVDAESETGFSCIAYRQGGKCLECRACWNPNIRFVSYPKH